jgi:hypothetical protein
MTMLQDKLMLLLLSHLMMTVCPHSQLNLSLKGLMVIGTLQGWYIDQWYNTLQVRQWNKYKTMKLCVECIAWFMDHHIGPPPKAAWASAVMWHWQGDA